MEKPISNNRLRNLGKAIAQNEGSVPAGSESDYEIFLDHYDRVKAEVIEQVQQVDLYEIVGGDHFEWLIAGRTKTLSTLADKLLKGSNLDTVRDIAGVRVVANCTLSQQDAIADILLERFESKKVAIDRRENPVSGYRALHIEIQYERSRVEIQIRTKLQHVWAEIYEGLGDIWGRGIRYGELPNGSDDKEIQARQRIVDMLQEWSLKHIAPLEEQRDMIAKKAASGNRGARRRWLPIKKQVDKLEKRQTEYLTELGKELGVAPPRDVP